MSEQTVYGDGVKTPQEIHDETLADPGIPAIQAEVMAEVGPQPVKTVPVTMGNGVTVRVPLQSEWRMDAMNFMRAGDFTSWAESVLSDDDLGLWDDWMDRNPKLGEVTQFFDELGKATGQAAGNRASRRQSARTRTR